MEHLHSESLGHLLSMAELARWVWRDHGTLAQSEAVECHRERVLDVLCDYESELERREHLALDVAERWRRARV